MYAAGEAIGGPGHMGCSGSRVGAFCLGAANNSFGIQIVMSTRLAKAAPRRLATLWKTLVGPVIMPSQRSERTCACVLTKIMATWTHTPYTAHALHIRKGAGHSKGFWQLSFMTVQASAFSAPKDSTFDFTQACLYTGAIGTFR
eukprot:jgi/Ulvmu1/10224/UM060_0024.1